MKRLSDNALFATALFGCQSFGRRRKGFLMTSLRLFAVILCLLVPLQVRAGQPINDLLNVPVPVKLDGSAYSVEEVRRAIIAGSQRRGWTPRLEGNSKIISSILVRSR